MKDNETTVGILLAGGLSRRYGSPKALAELEGRKFYEIIYDVLAHVCDEVVIVTRAELVNLFPKDYHVIVDREPFVGCGPLAGIYSAMEAVQASNYVVLPCDMPLMNSSVMDKLISHHHKDVTVVTSGKYIQPLVSVWSEGMKVNIKHALVNEQFKMTDVLDHAETVKIDEKLLSDSPRVFVNINTLENEREMKKWRKL